MATQTERTIDEITADILRAQVDGGRAVLTIGNGLIEAKGKLNHGEWLPWLTENVGYSEKQAENYMKIARNYSNPQLVADLGMRKALSLLPGPTSSVSGGGHCANTAFWQTGCSFARQPASGS